MHRSSRLELILWTSDVPALAEFLSEIGGMSVAEQHPGYARLDSGTSSLILHADEAYRGHPWYDALHREGAARGIGAEIRLGVDDVERRYRDALMWGASVVYPPYDMEGTRECQLLAPDGFMVTLWSPLRRR